MELRGCSQVHILSVIRGGEVIKMHNIARGKSVLKFKNIEEIYTSDFSQYDSPSNQPPKVNRSLAMANGFIELQKEFKAEYLEEEKDLDFGTITLKQLKRACKSKKRKASDSPKLAAVKQEVKATPFLEDEPELMETLCSWKRKVLKKSKAKKGRSKRASLVSETNNSGTLSLFDANSELYRPIQIKLEYPESDFSQAEANISNLRDDLGSSSWEVARTLESCSSNQLLAITLRGQQCGMPQSSQEYLVQPLSVDTSDCILNEVSCEFREWTGPDSSIFLECSAFEDIMMVDGSVLVNQPSVYVGPDCQREDDMTDPMIGNEERSVFEYGPSGSKYSCPQACSVTAPPGEDSPVEFHSFCLDGEAQQNRSSQSTDDNKHVDKFRSESLEDCYSTDEFNNAPVYGVGSLDNLTSMVNELSVADEIISELQPSFHNGEGSTSEGSQSMDDKNDTEAPERSHLRECNPTVQDDEHLQLTNHVTSLPSTTLVVEERRISVSDCSVAPLSSTLDIQSNHTEELTRLAANQGNVCEMMQHSPERLFSTRKTISPNSQERLRKAMSSAELQDCAEIHTCKDKLLPRKDEIKSSIYRPGVKRPRIIFTSRKPMTVNVEEVREKGQQTMRKGTDEVKVPQSRICVNSAHASPTSQCVGVCSCVQLCSKNAISFSKRQLKDTERLAMKLVEGLHSMKSVVVDALHYESRTGVNHRYNTDQVRIAVENVSRVEETAKKWLTMMTKDCNRFCKIMRLAETSAPSPEKLTPKERKITFADEAGGSLCNVKIFNNFETDMDVASPVKSEHEKGES